MATHLFKLAKALTSNMDSNGGPHSFSEYPGSTQCQHGRVNAV